MTGTSERRRALTMIVASLLLTLALVLAGPQGTDAAAHVYQRGVFLQRGFALWNNHWYAGRYSFVGYSLLYYPLAAAFGIGAVAVSSVVAAVASFNALLEREWGARAMPATVAFALVWPATTISGAFPFLLGVAFALVALLALQEHRRLLFASLSLLALLSSPLAFAFLGLVCLAVAGTRRARPRSLVLPALPLLGGGVLELLANRLFPAGGTFPFPPWTLAGALLFAVAGAALAWRHSPLLRALFVVYGSACAAGYLLPSELGANLVRLRYVALPLALLVLGLRSFRPRAASIAVIALAAVWNLLPLGSGFVRASADPAAAARYWQPAIGFLRRRLTPSYRVEAVATANHWEALYLPRADIPIARGWFRQDDFPQNSLLYAPLGAAAYRSWLRRLGVRYVLLEQTPLDYSAKREAALLRSGRAGLPVAFRFRGGTIYRVPAPRKLITGPGAATVVALTDRTVRIRVGAAGRYRLAVRYSPYWKTSRGCLTRAADGMTELAVRRGGRVVLSFAPTVAGALAMLRNRIVVSCASTRRGAA